MCGSFAVDGIASQTCRMQYAHPRDTRLLCRLSCAGFRSVDGRAHRASLGRRYVARADRGACRAVAGAAGFAAAVCRMACVVANAARASLAAPLWQAVQLLAVCTRGIAAVYDICGMLYVQYAPVLRLGVFLRVAVDRLLGTLVAAYSFPCRAALLFCSFDGMGYMGIGRKCCGI